MERGKDIAADAIWEYRLWLYTWSSLTGYITSSDGGIHCTRKCDLKRKKELKGRYGSHACNLSIWEAEAGHTEVSLAHRLSPPFFFFFFFFFWDRVSLCNSPGCPRSCFVNQGDNLSFRLACGDLTTCYIHACKEDTLYYHSDKFPTLNANMQMKWIVLPLTCWELQLV